MTLINYQDSLKTKESLIVLTVKLKINQWFINNYTVWSYTVKKIYKYYLHFFI